MPRDEQGSVCIAFGSAFRVCNRLQLCFSCLAHQQTLGTPGSGCSVVLLSSATVKRSEICQGRNEGRGRCSWCRCLPRSCLSLPGACCLGVAGDCARRAGVQLPGRPELTEDIYIFKMFENQIPCLLVLQCSGLLRHNHWLHWPLPGRKLHLHGRPRQWHDMRRDEHQRRLLD